MTTLNVTVKQTTTKGQTGFTGTVAIPGLKSTRLARKDGETFFPTTSALKTVARGVGKRLGLTVEYNETWKKAAKKSVKATCTQTKTQTKTTTCKGNGSCKK